MEIITIPGGVFDSNTYIIAHNHECAIVDCGVRAGHVMRVLEEGQLKPKYIILTHGHCDHVYHVQAIKEATSAPVYLHEQELDLYSDPEKNGFALFGMGRSVSLPEPDQLLRDRQRLMLGGIELEIIHTPGHSPGSICILTEKGVLTGDTLFAMSIGRTDLYGGSSRAIQQSIAERLFTLSEATIVYPGHGPRTQIGFEKANNPYVSE
jgi:hydroxyacylglutathione hydrolase